MAQVQMPDVRTGLDLVEVVQFSPREADLISMLGLTKHILVVDDEELLSEAMATVLKSWGRVSTTRANCVAAAIHVFEQKKVDLVITDVNMDVQNGYELVRYAKDHHPDVPVILISGKVNPYDDGECDPDVFKHIHAFLGKPFDFSELKAIVQEALEQVSGAKKQKSA